MTKEGGSMKVSMRVMTVTALNNLANMWTEQHHTTKQGLQNSYHNSIRYGIVMMFMILALLVINTLPLIDSYYTHGYVPIHALLGILGTDCLLYVGMCEMRRGILMKDHDFLGTSYDKPLCVMFEHDLQELRASIPHHPLAVLREFDCNMMHYRLEQWWLEIEEMFEMSRDAETELGREEAGSLALSEQERWQRMYDACARFMHMQPVQKLKCVEN